MKQRWTSHLTHRTFGTPLHPGFLHLPLFSENTGQYPVSSARTAVDGIGAVGPCVFFAACSASMPCDGRHRFATFFLFSRIKLSATSILIELKKRQLVLPHNAVRISISAIQQPRLHEQQVNEVEDQSMIPFLRPDWYPVQRKQRVQQVNASHELVVCPYDRRTVDLNMVIRYAVKSLNVIFC